MSAAQVAGRRHGQRGFTLLELVVAMVVFGLVGLGIFGVLVLGARSAASGERISEQVRRYRIATEILARQVASIEPIQLPREDEGLGGEDEASVSLPYFFGDAVSVEFVTTAAQRPDASGMAIVSYWLEDGTLMMSERPVFTAYGSRKRMGRNDDDGTVATALLYDVGSLALAYQRASDTDEWLEEWDAAQEDMLPACIRVDVRPAVAGGPDFYHELPVMVGTINQIAGEDEDFRSRRVRRGGGGGGGQVDPSPSPNVTTPPATVPDADDDDDDDDDDD